jgi:hypothetical protein
MMLETIIDFNCAKRLVHDIDKCKEIQIPNSSTPTAPAIGLLAAVDIHAA